MKTVIFCGGLGTRLSEETQVKPKPMVEIGGRPILWHIMKSYERHGFNDFTLALGYKGEVVKDYFLNYHARLSDLTVQLKGGSVQYSNPTAEDWSVSLVDTGANTLTGGRLLRLKSLLEAEGTFMLTYGDGVSDVDLTALLAFHRTHGKLATVTAVKPSARFGGMIIESGNVRNFKEKPQSGEGWINGGYFVIQPEFLELIDGDQTVFEQNPLKNMAKDGKLYTYKHDDFWMPMDTLRDKNKLNDMWSNNEAAWKIWK